MDTVDATDEEWSQTADGDHVCTIKIPQGSTRREASQRIHYLAAGWLADIHYETAQYHVASLKESVSKEEFIKLCSAYKTEGEPTADDELDPPIRPKLDTGKTRTYVEQLYAKVVDTARLARDKRDKELREKALAEQKNLTRQRSSRRNKPW